MNCINVLDLLGFNYKHKDYYDFPERKDININDQEVFFFGSKFSERKNMTLSDELMILQRAIACFNGKKVFYIPHRDEKEEKLVEIVKLGYEIKKLGKPAEIFFDETNVMPGFVVSYFSTTLYTCSLRYANVHVFFVNVVDFLLKDNSKISAKEIYSYYKRIGISELEILNIENKL